MRRYFALRLLWTVPTLLAISLLLFGLSRMAGGEEEVVRAAFGDLPGKPSAQREALRSRASQLGLYGPHFYFSVHSAALPDTLYRIFPESARQRMRRFALQSGDWHSVERFEALHWQALDQAYALPDSQRDLRNALLRFGDRLQRIESVQELPALLEQTPFPPQAAALRDALMAQAQNLALQPAPLRRYVPRWTWHGSACRYHRWARGFIAGDLGFSPSRRRPVWQELQPRLLCTLALHGLALFPGMAAGILLGLWMAANPSLASAMARRALLATYAMPVFWLGVLLILGLATPDIGLHWIQGVSVGPWRMGQESLGSWILRHADRITLPALAIGLHTMALFALHTRSSALEVRRSDYILAARARGISEGRINLRHVAPNALFPAITLLGSLIPSLFSGAVVLEYLFQYPGVGTFTQQAFLQRDYPSLFAVTMILATLSILGQLLADLLYAWLDPRIRY